MNYGRQIRASWKLRKAAWLLLALAVPAQARQEFLPLISPGFVEARGEKPNAFGLGSGWASYDGAGHSLSGPVFAWTLRHGMSKGWGLFVGSDAALLSGNSEGGSVRGQGHTSIGGASLRAMAGKEFPLGGGTGTLAFGAALPFTIASYETSIDITALGKRSSLTPDTALALSIGLPVCLTYVRALGESWSLRPHALAALWPRTGLLYVFKFAGPFSPRSSATTDPYITLEGGLAVFHRTGLGVTSRFQWTSSAGATAATRGVSAGLAYEFGF